MITIITGTYSKKPSSILVEVGAYLNQIGTKSPNTTLDQALNQGIPGYAAVREKFEMGDGYGCQFQGLDRQGNRFGYELFKDRTLGSLNDSPLRFMMSSMVLILEKPPNSESFSLEASAVPTGNYTSALATTHPNTSSSSLFQPNSDPTDLAGTVKKCPFCNRVFPTQTANYVRCPNCLKKL
jgi:hypothetical protein